MSENQLNTKELWQYCLLLPLAIILLAWLIIPLVDYLSAKVICPFTDALPYEDKMIVIIISVCMIMACIVSVIFIIRLPSRLLLSWRKSLCLIATAFAFILVWGFERFVSDNWSFLPLFNTNIALVDLLILSLFIALVTITYATIRITKGDKIGIEDTICCENEDSMFSDRPISDESQDVLRRSPFAQKLVTKIEELNTTEGARSLAVTASWGNGKTSFLNLVKNGLKKKGCFVVDITPWNLNPDKSITTHFFEEIINKFGGIDHQIAKLLKRYSNALDSVNLGLFSTIFSNISLSEMAEKISNAMIRKDIKTIVVFDDIDRLEASEIEEVFRIIRGSANFKNFIFLSAFDKRYVQQALQNANAAFNEHYIEKFFEMEFPLPEIRTDLIESIILDNTHWLSETDQESFKNYITRDMQWIGGAPPYAPLTNLRIVHRWLNALKYKYEILREECIIDDLADLEMINLLFPQVYTLLATEYENFFECESHQNSYKLWDESMKVSPDSDWIKSLTQKRKRNLMDHCKTYLGMNENQCEVLSTILDRLLPKHRYQADAKAFSNHNYTQRYFDSILAQNDIPQSEFDAMIDGNTLFEDFIDNDKEQVYAHSLFLLCYDAKPSELDKLHRLLNIIFYAACHYDRFGMSYYTIRDKLYKFNLSHEDKKQMFMDLMTNYSFSNYVFMSLIPSRYSDRNGWQEIFTEDECDKILADLYNKAIEEGYSFQVLFDLYCHAKEKTGEGNGEKSYECKNEIIRSAYKYKLAEYSIKDFSYLIFIKHPEDNEYYPSIDFVQLWEDMESFVSFLNENKLHNQMSPEDELAFDEFKTFVNQWSTNGKKPIPFTFTHIDKLKK